LEHNESLFQRAQAYQHGELMNRILLVSIFAIFALTLASPAQQQPPTPGTTTSNPAQDPQLFRNTTFGFRYQIPYGWVDRTQAMNEGSEASKQELLLATFERPPEAAGDTINSAVVIASESTTSYPGIKKAEDYVGPLTELASAKGLKPEGEPYALEVESRQLVRVDFVRTISEKLTMRQCTLVLLAKRQIVSFTFIAGSEDELDDLMDGLHFGAAKSPAH
jgi:hypothetical protein